MQRYTRLGAPYLGLVVVVCVLLSACSKCFAAPQIAPLKYPVKRGNAEGWVPFASSHSPSEKEDTTIKRILFSMHSSGFDALQYLENARIAASKVPGASRETLIIAPQFLAKNVLPEETPDGLLYWRVSPYRGSSLGAIGPDERKVGVSAYAILDEMLTRVADKRVFPNLRDIVLVGHSAGGQLVQRYALVGKFEPPRGINCRFVVCAPSSFAYPTAERHVPGSRDQFARPSDEAVAANPKYNQWGYGLDKPYGYFRGFDREATFKRYGRRRVYYLCGERDNNPNDKSISKNGSAMMQGRHRRERMETFHRYLLHTYGKGIARRHKLAITPGVGHYGRGNMTSKAGLRFLFADNP